MKMRQVYVALLLAGLAAGVSAQTSPPQSTGGNTGQGGQGAGGMGPGGQHGEHRTAHRACGRKISTLRWQPRSCDVRGKFGGKFA